MEDFLDEIPDEELCGERVMLRLLHEGDAEDLYSVINANRDFLSQHLPWPAECTCVEDVAARIDSWGIQAQMGNGGCWGIFACGSRPAGGSQLTGVIILGWIQAQHRSATVSYWLGEPFTGRGLATEALRTLSRYAFDQLGLNRLEISAAVSNSRSAAVATRAGFTQEGFCREYEFINGKFLDHVRFSLLARDPR